MFPDLCGMSSLVCRKNKILILQTIYTASQKFVIIFHVVRISFVLYPQASLFGGAEQDNQVRLWSISYIQMYRRIIIQIYREYGPC